MHDLILRAKKFGIASHFPFLRRRGSLRYHFQGASERKGKEVDTSNAKMTFMEAAILHMQRIAENLSLKKRHASTGKKRSTLR